MRELEDVFTAIALVRRGKRYGFAKVGNDAFSLVPRDGGEEAQTRFCNGTGTDSQPVFDSQVLCALVSSACPARAACTCSRARFALHTVPQS